MGFEEVDRQRAQDYSNRYKDLSAEILDTYQQTLEVLSQHSISLVKTIEEMVNQTKPESATEAFATDIFTLVAQHMRNLCDIIAEDLQSRLIEMLNSSQDTTKEDKG